MSEIERNMEIDPEKRLEYIVLSDEGFENLLNSLRNVIDSYIEIRDSRILKQYIIDMHENFNALMSKFTENAFNDEVCVFDYNTIYQVEIFESFSRGLISSGLSYMGARMSILTNDERRVFNEFLQSMSIKLRMYRHNKQFSVAYQSLNN